MDELEQKALEIEQKKREDELLKSYDGPDKVISSVELKKKIEAQPKSGFKLGTHLAEFNTYFDGFREGNLIVVSGHTGDGKTAFCQDLTRSFTEDGVASLWFSYEMGEEEFLERFQIAVPVFYLPAELKNSVDWFRKKIREAVLKFNTKVVFIDHLHFMTGMKDLNGHFGDLSTYLGLITQELKLIAIEHKLVIFLIVHPRKGDNTQALGLDEVGRDSSFIVQNADAVISIWREKKRTATGIQTSELSYLGILKNRRKGKLGKITLAFNNGIYSEWTPESYQFKS